MVDIYLGTPHIMPISLDLPTSRESQLSARRCLGSPFYTEIVPTLLLIELNLLLYDFPHTSPPSALWICTELSNSLL